MSHSYSTPPPSVSSHPHFAMCTEHHRIYGHVLSTLPTFQTLQHFLRFPMADSCLSPDASISIDPVTNLNPILANTASAPLHTHLTTCLTACALVCRRVPCLPHASPLLPRRASAILAKIYRVANPHHLRPHCRQPSVNPDRCRVPRISRTLTSSPTNVLLAFPLTRLRFSGSLHRSPSISRVKSPPETPAPPST